MTKVPYSKPPLTYEQQLNQLKSRGLIIEDEGIFLDILERKSYYRLSGYWYPLLKNKKKHLFKEGASFSTAYHIYCFDKNLRQLVINELEKIEIAVRAKMIYIFSHQFGPFWYTDASIFKNKKIHSETISKIRTEFERSDARFIHAFKKKYNNPLPPSWAAFEIISFGSVSRLYSIIRSGKSKRELAEYFGLDDSTFCSWLHGLVYVRNVCAHHSRLWNRIMRIQPRIPNNPKNKWLSDSGIPNNRTYYILSMILYLLNSINEKNSIVSNFKSLLSLYPTIDLSAMGFPQGWKNEKLWM